MAATAGRQRYRWLVLLASAVVLLVWMFTPAPRDGDRGVMSAAPRADPPPYTAAADAPTTFPSTHPAEPDDGLGTVRLSALPPEAVQVVERVAGGGPFDEGGIVFDNRDGLLPQRPRGHYGEYAVPTGTSRVVVGADGEVYWSGGEGQPFVRVER